MPHKVYHCKEEILQFHILNDKSMVTVVSCDQNTHNV